MCREWMEVDLGRMSNWGWWMIHSGAAVGCGIGRALLPFSLLPSQMFCSWHAAIRGDSRRLCSWLMLENSPCFEAICFPRPR